jgi:hypothetical protein
MRKKTMVDRRSQCNPPTFQPDSVVCWLPSPRSDDHEFLRATSTEYSTNAYIVSLQKTDHRKGEGVTVNDDSSNLLQYTTMTMLINGD